MIVTSKIKLDMAQQGVQGRVSAVQGDGNTRAVEAELLANGSSWTPDGGWEAAITYRKPDGTKGLYNLLEDGSSAITISGSTATVILASQMLTEPGTVRAAIVFNNQRLDQLTSFPFLVSVARNQFAGAQQSEDYIRLQWLEDKLEERIAQLISTEEAVRAGVAAQEATTAASRADTAAAGADTAKENADAAASAANTAAAAAQEEAAAAGNAAASANAAASRADTAASGADTAKENADTAAAAAQAVVDGIVPEVEQLRSDLTDITPDDASVDGKPWTSKKIVDSLCQPFEETGNPVQCYPVENYPLGVKIRIEPVQEGEGDPSPDNIRPITGRDAVSVTRCGKNLVEHRYAPGYTMTENGLTFTVNGDYSVTVTGTAKNETYFDFVTLKNFSPIRYNINAMNKTVTQNGFTLKDISYEYAPRKGVSFLYLVIVKGQVVDRTYYPMMIYGEDTAYEPYTGSTTGIDLPETVYGGTLDLESGVVNTTWGHIASYAGEPLPGEWISDRDTYAPDATPTTGAQVAYKLAQPYTIQITPQQIAALSGVNTIYTNADSVLVTGAEDPKHTITELKNAIISLGGNI